MNDQEPIEEEKKEVQVERRVPQGRLAHEMDMYIRMHHQVGSVIESESERDSWPEKSVQAARDKQSDDSPKLMENYLTIKQDIAELNESVSLPGQSANADGSNSMGEIGVRKVGSMKNVVRGAAQLQMAQNQMDSNRANGAQA